MSKADKNSLKAVGYYPDNFAATGAIFLAAAVVLFWLGLNRRVPGQRELVAVNGTITRNIRVPKRAVVFYLGRDQRRFCPYKRLLPSLPIDNAWRGKEVELITDANPTGNVYVYSLKIDGQVVYDADDVRDLYRREFPWIISTAAIFMVASPLLFWIWLRRI